MSRERAEQSVCCGAELRAIAAEYGGTAYYQCAECGQPADPRTECPNCDGRKCMGCVTREYGHDCQDDCPFCCESNVARRGQYEWRSVLRLPDGLLTVSQAFDELEHVERDAERWKRAPFNAEAKHIFIQRREVGAWEDSHSPVEEVEDV